MEPIILLHGGAGKHNKKDVNKAKQVLKKAADEGFQIFSNGGSSEDVVEKCINILEDSECFNAGIGADLQLDGKVRLDASIMTSELECGAVSCLENIKYAISVARKIMEKTHHVLLSGIYATEFAEKELGMPLEDLRTEKKIKSWKKLWLEVKDLPYKKRIKKIKRIDNSSTVGCVVLDKKGKMAAGTSTGGREPQLAGRVGDTPLIGCGTYCNEFAAVSATGIGEAIIKTTLARRCCEYIEQGLSPQKSAEKAIKYLANKTKSTAGLIVIDKNKRYGIYYNTEEMLWYKR